MNGLDLFSGIGGIAIALEPWVNTVAYCERDKFAQAVLLSRMAEGRLHKAPIWTDVETLDGDMLPRIDIISGGFPCQDISVAGFGAGLGGKRSGLFFEIIRLTKKTNPRFVFLENVPAIRTRGLHEVVRAFAEIGYDCRWTCISASSVGAAHKRERWFLLAHLADSESVGAQGLRAGREQVAHPHEGEEVSLCSDQRGIFSDWKVEPDVARMVDGLSDRAHRIKCLGNSVVPKQVRQAFLILSGLSEEAFY